MNAFYSKLSEFRKKCILTENPHSFLHRASQLYFLLMNTKVLISTKDWVEVQNFENEVPDNQEDLFHYLWFLNALSRYHCFIWNDYEAALEVTNQIIRKVEGLFQHTFAEDDMEKKSMLFILTLNIVRLSFYQRSYSQCFRQLKEFKSFLDGEKDVQWENFSEDLRNLLKKFGPSLIAQFKSEDFEYFNLKLKVVEDRLLKEGLGFESLLESCYSHFKFTPAKEAFIDYDKSLAYSWSEVEDLSNGIASLIEAHSDKSKTQYLLICTQQNIFFPTSIIAAWKAHFIPVMIHENYTDHELEQIEGLLKDHNLVYLTDGTFKKKSQKIIVLKEEIKKSPRKEINIEKNDFALGLFTSGSSGTPKLCLFTHENLLSAAQIEVENDSLFKDGKIANLRPHYTSAGLNSLWPSLLLGNKNVFSEKIRKTPIGRFLNEFLVKEDLSMLILSPTYILSLFHSGDEGPKATKKLPLYFGGSSLPWSILKNLMEHNFLPSMRYGMTEVAHIISRKSYYARQEDYEKSDVGIPFKNFQLSCPNGFVKINSPGNASVIIDRGVTLNISKEAGYVTADQAFLEPYGALKLEGRDNNTISINGFRFNPQQVEEVLMQSDSIVDCRVVGIKNNEDEQKLHAYILIKKDKKNDLVESELRNLAKEKLSSFKQPLAYHFLSEWPMSANGKIDFNKLV